MNFNYTGPSDKNKMKVRFEKPENYPNGFNSAADAVNKITKHENKSRERSISKERIINTKMGRYNSIESLMTPSLKRQLSNNYFTRTKSNEGRERSTSITRKNYRLSDYKREIGRY